MSDLRHTDGTEWRDGANQINVALHRAIGEEPCQTGCLHHLTNGWTLLGLANVAARNGTNQGATA